MSPAVTTRVSLLAALAAFAISCGPATPDAYDPSLPPPAGDTAGAEPEQTPAEQTEVAEAPPPELEFPEDEEFRDEQPRAGEPRPFQLPKIQTFKLANGLDVFLVEQHALPVVSADIVFEGGSVNDPKGKEGLASVCMAMMSEGTEKLDKVAFEEALADIASNVSTYAGSETQGISMRTLSKHLDATRALFVDTLLRPGFRDEDFERMIDRRLESLKQAKGSPRSVARRLDDSVLYGPRHPLGRVTTEASYRAITLADCKRYHRRFVKPRGAKLFVVGDMTPAQVKASFATIKGWRGRQARARRLPRPQTRRGRIFFVDIPGAAQSSVSVMHMGPRRTAKDYFATAMMSAVLGGSFSSRVNMNLREDKGYSYGARGGFTYSRNFGEFTASSSVRSDSTYQTVIELMNETRSLYSGTLPATDAELTREQNGAILGLPGSFATARQALGRYRSLVYYGLPLDYYNDYVDNVGAVTLEQVNAAAKKHLRPSDAVILVVGDADAAQIRREGDEDVPLTGEGDTQLTLRESLDRLVTENVVGKGEVVVLDVDGKPVQ